MYDKSDLIKETYITTLNNDSISCFNKKKTDNEIFKIIRPKNLLKFFVNKNTSKDSLSFQRSSISGNLPSLKDKKIDNVSLKRIERKRKLPTQGPVETAIIRVQQNFEIARDLTLFR